MSALDNSRRYLNRFRRNKRCKVERNYEWPGRNRVLTYIFLRKCSRLAEVIVVKKRQTLSVTDQRSIVSIVIG